MATIFLAGDVMTGRGIDQVLPHPSDPQLHESYIVSAAGYVALAERLNGPIPRPVDYSYIWGDALEEWVRRAPEVRIVNLETSVTTSTDFLPKGINYRMNPNNVPCLQAAGIDCCILANNHVLDWGDWGLLETLDCLKNANLKTAGAGRNRTQAEAPAIVDLAGGARVIVFALGSTTSGIPEGWAATEEKPGVNLLPDVSDDEVVRIAAAVGEVERPGDIVLASIHWGRNWGYEVPDRQRVFARKLVDEASVDIVHGHSSHHPKAMEVYKTKPILYGCGDFLNDYEGISGHEEFRSHLVLMYFVTLDESEAGLSQLRMVPLEIKRFRLHRAARADADWLRDVLDAECRKLGTEMKRDSDNSLVLGWH